MADGSLKFDTKIDTEGFEQDTKTLKDRIGGVVDSLKQAGVGATRAFTDTGAMDKSNASIQKLVDSIDQYRDNLYALERQGLYFGDEQYDTTYAKLSQAETSLKSYQKELAGTDREQKKATKSNKRLNSSLKKTSKTSAPLVKSIFKLSNMFKLLALRMAMRSIIRSVQEGFGNLAQYSNQANKDMSALQTSLQTLKNSFATAFAPILEFVTPALQTLIGHLSQAITTAGQFFAVLLNGSTTFTRAKDAQVDYAKSLKDTAKAASKTLSPIDKLNVVSDTPAGEGYEPPAPGQMFEEVEIDSGLVGMIEKFKASLEGLFEPIKESWATHGQGVIESVKSSFGSVKGLLGEVGKSFKTVWLGGSGEKTVDNLLQTFSNINETISSIATNFKKAWVTDGTGTKIIQNIWNILNNILSMIRRITGATAEWASGLDFAPILTSFQGLTESLEPLTSTIADGIVWFYENALLPLAEWTITDVIPLFFDGLEAALDILNNTLEALKPLAMWLLDNFLIPLAEWTGGVIVSVLGWIVDRLKDFGNWIKDHESVVEAFAIVVGSFAAAWVLVNGAIAIWNVISAIATGLTTAFGVAVGFLTSPITLVVLAIGALIAIVVLLVKNWDKVKAAASKCWEGIKNIWSKVSNWFNTKIVQPISKFFSNLWTNLKTGASNALNGLKTAFSTVFNALINIVKKPINAVIGIINGLIGGVVSGINAVIRAINSISFTLPSWVPGIGGKGIGFNIKEFTAPKIPKLATGTVVPANYGEFVAILGDNTREAEVVSPVSKIEEAVENVLNRRGGDSQDIHIWLEGDAQGIFKVVRVADKEYRNATGKSAFAH